MNLIGYTKEQFEGELHSQYDYVHPDDLEHVTAVMLQARESGKSTAVESRVVTRDGAVRILMVTIAM